MEKLLQLLTDIDNLEDFIKVSVKNTQHKVYFDITLNKEIPETVANEMLRLISEMKTRALK